MEKTSRPRNFWEKPLYQRHKIQLFSREAIKYAKYARCDDKDVCHSKDINKTLQHVIAIKTTTKTGKTQKNSVENCDKKVLEPFKP